MYDVTHSYVRRDTLIYISDIFLFVISTTHGYTQLSCEWLISYICAKWLIHTCDMTHSYVWHDSFIRVTWLIHTCDMTHSYVWHDSLIRISDIFLFLVYTTRIYTRLSCYKRILYMFQHDSFIRVTWPIHTCDMTHLCVWHDSFIRVTWLTYTCDMTRSYVCHDSFIRVTWLIHTCAMTHSYVWHDSLLRLTWRIHTCDMTHLYVWHDSFIRVTWLVHTCDMTRLHASLMCHSVFHTCSNMTHSYVWHDSFIRISNIYLCVVYTTPFVHNFHVTWLTPFICVTWLIHTCDMTRSYVWHDSFIRVT